MHTMSQEHEYSNALKVSQDGLVMQAKEPQDNFVLVKSSQKDKTIRSSLGYGPEYSIHDSVYNRNTKYQPTEILPLLSAKDHKFKPPTLPKFGINNGFVLNYPFIIMNKYNKEKKKTRVKSSRNKSEPDKISSDKFEKYYEDQRKNINTNDASSFQANQEEADLNQKIQTRNTISSSSEVKRASENGKSSAHMYLESRNHFAEIYLEKPEINTHLDILSQYQNKPTINQPTIKTIYDKIDDQADLVQRVKFTTKKYQKAESKSNTGSPIKGQVQKTGIRNYMLENVSKNQNKQLPNLIVLGNTENKQQNKEFENTNKLTQPLRFNSGTPVNVGELGTSTLINRKKISTAINTGANIIAASTNISKPIESKRIIWALTDEEKNLYGDRCPDGYEKIDLLGRGGFAIVWLAKKKSTGEKVALKQILNKNSRDCMQKEIHFGQVLFTEGGAPRAELRGYPGIDNIIKFIDYKQTRSDTWLIFELGGSTLSKMLFEIKGEFFKGERIYNVKHLEMCKSLRENPKCLKAYIKQMAQTLDLLSELNIIHCDLKPDNVLLTKSSETDHEKLQIKLIDFGSAFSVFEPGSFGMATPEYMPPEVLTYLSNNPGSREGMDSLLKRGKNWSIDVWSLGAILLEIITGIPLWLSLKCKACIKDKIVYQVGLFAVKGRDYEKIKLRQKTVLDNLESMIGEYLYEWENANELFNLLQGMLQWDPKMRISPSEILDHSYLLL